jgi:hypothetical protein
MYMLKDVYIKGDWRCYEITFSGRKVDVRGFLSRFLDFLNDNKEFLYRKSRHRTHSSIVHSKFADDWVRARFAVVGKPSLWLLLQRFMWVEQKNECFADYSLHDSPAQASLACDW